MTEPTALDAKLRNRLTRYLHTGNEVPKYYPGCWLPSKYFGVENLPVINEALSNNPNNVEVVDIILQAYKDGQYTRFETIAFALSKCLLVGTSPVKEATYKAAAQICNTSEELMTFNKFTRHMNTGNGRGWCKHVRQWYGKYSPMVLAKEITRVRSLYGRSHKTLIRKSHVKVDPNDNARNAVVKYVIYGLRRAKQLTTDMDETKEIFDYIQTVEDFRHCEDPTAATALAIKHKFTLDHVPGHLLTSQDVWNAILPQFSLPLLLYNIQRIHNMGFLTANSTTTAIVVSLLNDKEVIQKSKVTPLAVYITLSNYKNKSRPVKHAKAKVILEKEARRRTRQIFDTQTGLWEWTVTRRHPKEIKNWGIDLPPSPAVIAALLKLVDLTWLQTPPTNARYMITLDMRNHMFKGRHFCKSFVVPKKIRKVVSPGAGGDADTEKKSKKRLLAECFYNKHVTPGHAALILALHLLKREKCVKLAVFSDEGVQVVSIERNFSSIEEAEFVFRKANVGHVQLDAPIEWAANTNQKFDVFINMIDRPSRYMELDIKERGGRGEGGRFGPPPSPDKEIPDHCPVRALERYRSKLDIPDAKLIVMSLASHRSQTTDGSHEGVLDIVGVDERVPQVMDAFVLGQFK